MLSYSAKVLKVVAAGLALASGQDSSAKSMKESCSVFDKYEVHLFHSGFYRDNNCHEVGPPPLQTHSTPTEKHLLNMREKLVESGGELNKVWPHEFRPGYRGMVATDDIAEGELIAFVPRWEILTYKEADQISVVSRFMIENMFFLDGVTFKIRSDQLRLILFIMQERRNPFSEWHDWAQTLAQDWSTHMIFLGEDDLAWFEGSILAHEAVMTRMGLKTEYETLCEKYPGFGSKHSAQAFLEAYKMVTSRAFDAATVHPLYEQKMMVPFLDMFNHRREANVKWEYNREGNSGYYVHALAPIKRGEELFGNYAEGRSNKDLLLTHGLYDIGNDVHLPVMLRVDLYQNDPLLPAKQFWFKQGDFQFGYVVWPIGDFESDLT